MSGNPAREHQPPDSKELMRFFGIVLLTLFFAIAYGVLHDQVTVRVSLEYFTVAHPMIFKTESPTLLALGWGVMATWWVALPFGFLLASGAQHGRRYPELPAAEVARLLFLLMAVMAGSALAAGLVGYYLCSAGLIALPEGFAESIPLASHNSFMAAWWSHAASYLVGVSGAVILLFVIRRKRKEFSAERTRIDPGSDVSRH